MELHYLFHMCLQILSSEFNTWLRFLFYPIPYSEQFPQLTFLLFEQESP